MDILTYGALLNKIKDNKPTDEQVAQAVDEWLDDHPEATTTVQDGSITHAKLDSDLQDAVDEVADLKSQMDDLQDALVNGSTKTDNHIQHETLIYGSYASGNTLGTPTGGGGQTRAVYGKSIPMSDIEDVGFAFDSNGLYNIGFAGFNESGVCLGAPRAWLNDGTYTKAQILANLAGGVAPYVSFQIKPIGSGNLPSVYADDIASVQKTDTFTISPSVIREESIEEDKLSQAVQNKLNDKSVDNLVDVIIFMGQSNMAGRGDASDAPALIPGAGYEYRAISAPNQLSPMVEPFGATESNPNGINEGSAKTGSMVTAFTNAYYTYNGKVPVVGISASKGGTPIADWQPGGAYLTDAISRLTSCVTYLTNNGYTIRHKYILWCQGETDGDNGTTAADYKTLFDTMLAAMITQGIEKLFMVRIGNYNYQTSTKYDAIMDCQTEIAQTENKVVMASTDFAGMRARGLMKDAWHYYQAAYNEVGEYSGVNVAIYEQTGKEPTMYDTKDGTLYFTHKN